MTIQTCQFVPISDVFEGFPKLQKKLAEGDGYDFSWGDNNRSMIDRDTLINALAEMDGVDYEPEEGEEVDAETVTSAEWNAFCDRLNALPPDVYIDLEN